MSKVFVSNRLHSSTFLATYLPDNINLLVWGDVISVTDKRGIISGTSELIKE
jgi:hypothetical protein